MTNSPDSSIAFVREHMVDEMPAPNLSTGIVGWMRTNLFNSIGNTILTLFSIVLIYSAASGLFSFALGSAIFEGTGGADCRIEGSGACWPYIGDRFNFMIYGFYPETDYWRPNLVFAVGSTLLFLLATPQIPGKMVSGILFLVVFPFVAYFIMAG
jgi:general L-amino acid transport system permease protein